VRPFLYLAPHLDDAVLSCGGLIARQVQEGRQALVLTIFAGDPSPGPETRFAAVLAGRSQTPRTYPALRRAEDRAAVESLGASWLHWIYPDCIYRLHPLSGEPLYTDEVAIFGEVHPSERGGLLGGLTVRLQALCDQLCPATVYAPLTVGHHVDHHLVQWASRRLTRRGWNLRFYEDYPYVAWPGCLEGALGIAGDGWQPELEPMTPDALQAKTRAISCYLSQLHGLFGGEEAMPGLVEGYARSLCAAGPAERFWRPQAVEAGQ
jgi:LmbE family N-acetylglucosaminyl deacetylase